MKITKIKILKSKVTVYFGKEKLDLDKEVYPNFYLYEGKEVSSKEYKEIKEYNNIASLLKYAMRIRQKSVYSEYKLREKLYNKGGSKKEVDKVISTLKAYDLIDDDAYMNDYVEYCNSLNYGKHKIIKKLNEKGIFEEKIRKLKFPDSIENRKAKILLSKLEKKYDKYNYSSKKSHIYNAYILEGFESDIAIKYSSMIKEVDIKEENKKLDKDYLKVKERLKRKYKGKELKEKLISSLLTKGYRYKDIFSKIEKEEY